MSNVDRRGPRFALAALTWTYVAVTVAESVLAPVLPILAAELSLTTAAGARLLGSVSLAAAVGNLAGGALLARSNARVTSLVGATSSVAGSALAAASSAEGTLLVAHALIGFGAGFFFAGGVFSVGMLASAGRRGRAMGRYGIAYSVALALAAVLVATLGVASWRATFIAAAALSAAAAILLLFVELPAAEPVGERRLRHALPLLRAPVLVGGVAAVAQFGLVAYIPTFSVSEWSTTATAAALVLFVGRVVSVPGKAVAGWMIDRFGAAQASRMMGAFLIATSLLMVLSPIVVIGMAGAVLFASAAGAMFPMANVVAVDRFGDLGGLLGVFRAAQMAIAGISVWLVGQAADRFGLTTAVLIGTAGLAAIFFVPGRRAGRLGLDTRSYLVSDRVRDDDLRDDDAADPERGG